MKLKALSLVNGAADPLHSGGNARGSLGMLVVPLVIVPLSWVTTSQGRYGVSIGAILARRAALDDSDDDSDDDEWSD